METNAIAVVGMAGRFPGARNIEEFWRNLRGAIESVKTLSDGELRAAGANPEALRDPNYVKSGAVLEDVDLFDASFFGFSPKDASIMDPQHRHFLECAWQALEHAGHVPDRFNGSIGVYAGSGMNAYMLYNLLTNRELVESAGLFLIRQTGNDKDVLATRVSYQFNLRGPSINIQTACSTSLVAIHMACQSLLNHECDMALAGGVTIEIPHGLGYSYREGEILSQDGHCRAFDARATGTVFGSGAGIVVLRRLEDAQRDGDTIHAVIKGSAINNDGSRKVGYLAPSVDGQAEVITEALAVAGVDAASISYLETHGTGTRVGDPIEISGLTQAFRRSTLAKGYCAIGSVKTNIGHLDTAAGVAGFIKTVLALKHRQLPPSLHFEKANPLIDFENSPFYVNAQLREWMAHGTPRRAGVTSLGIGGTNAHVILEEAPETVRAGRSRAWQLVVLSAKSVSALDTMSANLARHIEGHPELDLADISFTCQLGRKEFRHRRTLVCRSGQEARETLTKREPGPPPGAVSEAGRSAVFLFSGQGSQYVEMARELYEGEPVFREHVDSCAELLRPHLDLDLRKVLYPSKDGLEGARAQINQTWLTQPALFVIEYALARLWISWGLRPKAMAGHSIGEYVAACLSGVFSLESALAIVSMRARLMQSLPPGAMTAVPLAESEVAPLLSQGLAIAAINGPRQSVLSGPAEAIERLEKDLSARDIPFHRLHTSHAFHSAMVDPILLPFAEVVGRFNLNEPKIPYLSNVTGTWVRAEDAKDPAYWARHLRGTVRFAGALEELFKDPGLLLVEVGPGTALASLAKQHPQKPKQQRVFHSLRHPHEQVSDYQVLLSTLGQLWNQGAHVDWAGFRGHDAGFRVPLPTYPFEHRRHWIEPGSHAFGAVAQPAPLANAEWFYDVIWEPTPLAPVSQPAGESCWLVFSDGTLGDRIKERLVAIGEQVVIVKASSQFSRLEDWEYALSPGRREDYDALVADLVARNIVPRKIVHLWTLNAPTGLDSLEESENLSFYSLLFLAQAFGEKDIGHFQMAVVSSGMQSVNGEAVLRPESAMVLGPCNVIPKEFPGVTCQSIDIGLPSDSAPERIIEELAEARLESAVAYRGNERWVPAFALKNRNFVPDRSRLRENGVYLITGGMGGIGMVVAERLAKDFHARLVLTGRTVLPVREQWDSFLSAHAADDSICRKIRKVRELEKLGSEVLLVSADVASHEQMREVIARARERFGTLHGVFHAAGVLGDGLIQLKERAAAQQVLAPKVKGTLVLDNVLAGTSLDFLVLFSSISALVPPVGQVDYAAANAFLNAFAQSKAGPNDGRVIAISWGLWSDAGMAARSLDQHGSATRHPLLGDRLSDNLHETIYSGRYSCDAHWILKEHRFRGGEALFPGTGYLEMAGAALNAGSQPIELRNVFFVAPLTLGSAESREVRLLLQKDQQGCRFSVVARLSGSGQWQEYAAGQARRRDGGTARISRLDEISARCNTREISFANQRTKQEKYFEFGPRWSNLKKIRIGTKEALAVLELDEKFHADLETYRIHPALFDLATGSALYLIGDYESSDDLYLPFSYEKLTIWGRLTAVCYSHIRPREKNPEDGIAIFDITIMDAAGRTLIDIEGYAVRRISDPDPLLAGQPRTSGSAERSLRPSPEGNLLERRIEEGISSAQGSEALLRILSTTGIGPHIIVSRQNLEKRLLPSKTLDRALSSAAPQTEAVPRDEIENVLAGWWVELLGAERVGVQDDFFDLGGHSLVAVRLFTKIKRVYDVDLGLGTLFEARTVEKLAAVIRAARNAAGAGPEHWSSLVSIQPRGSRPPIYFVGGWGGNVLTFEFIARYIGPDQPVYGLQPEALDGRKPFLTRMEDIASSYLPAIRSVQPHGPYYLGGYSFGGVVAFEMAQQLRAQGEEVALVAFIDTIEWRYWQRAPTPSERLELYKLRVKKLFFDSGGLEYLKDRLRAKGRRARNSLYKVIGRPIPVVLRTIVDANRFAAAHYEPRIYPGRITLLRCSERDIRDRDDYFLGWGGFAAGGIDVVDVPGHHLTITKEPNVRVLAEKLRSCIDKTLAGSLAQSESQVRSQGADTAESTKNSPPAPVSL